MFKALGHFRLLAFVFPILLMAGPTFAWVGVGPLPSCEVRTIQAAVDRIIARQRNGDFSDPNIAIAGGNFTGTLTFDNLPSGAVLHITGGYNAGCSGLEVGSTTRITAANPARSVLSINGGISLFLDSLQITGANTSGNGGGISFDGTGTLDAFRVSIFGNHAGRGGGIYANGQSGGLKIKLHQSTFISSNSADHAGGGMRIQGNTRLFMLEGDTFILNNSVNPNDSDGAGGGLEVVGPARADIGSGTISGNSARYGGGVSVHGSSDDNGTLRFFMTLPDQPTRIQNNTASATGGGIFVGSNSPFASTSTIGIACGFGFSISANAAQEGAALYLDTSSTLGTISGSVANLTSSALLGLPNTFCAALEPATALGAIGCAVGAPCNTINDNRAQDSSGHPTDGSALLVQSESEFRSERVELRRNLGSHVLRGFSAASFFPRSFSNCLLADNKTTSDLIRIDEGGALLLSNCTLTGNLISGAKVLSLTGDLTARESLLWQPGKTILGQDSGHSRNVRNVLASEIVSLGDGDTVIALNPQFVAPALGGVPGDYHLRPTSPALDFAPALAGADLEGGLRTVDLARPNRPGGGPLDLGAYEQRAVFPPDETFDEVIAPALPPQWINTHTSNSVGWVNMASGAFSPPNAAFTEDSTLRTDKSLETPAFNVVANGQVSFRHNRILELTNDVSAADGVVLEIALSNGAFVDILAAGGSFVSGGYSHITSRCCVNPLEGRAVWSGISQGYQSVVVNLPVAANGQSVKLRWRMGTDFTGGIPGGGYWLDDIHVNVNASIPTSDAMFSNGFE